MTPKYTEGQKVKVVLVKDQHMHVKYPEFEPYVSKRGTIVDSLWVEQEGIGMEGVDVLREYYLYTVRIGNKEVEGIPEECLELCVD